MKRFIRRKLVELQPLKPTTSVNYDSIARRNVFKRKDNVDVYIPALPPNKKQTILFAHHFEGDLLDDIYKINELIRQGQLPETEERLNSIPQNVKPQVKLVFGLSGKALDQLRRGTTFNFEGVDSTFAHNEIELFIAG